jgi:hypothetical protein
VETETFTALTASGRSPERRRSLAEARWRGLTEPTTTVLRGRNERKGSSGNVWRNWGYLAERRQGWADRWRQPTGRWRSERNSLAPQVGLEPTTIRLTAIMLTEGLYALVLSRGLRVSKTPPGTAALGSKLFGEAVTALAVGAFGGLNRSPHLLPERAAQEAADRMRLPAGRLHQFLQCYASGPFQ